MLLYLKTLEPVHEKTNNLGFRPGLTQTRLYSHRRQLEAITAKLICAFVFAYADCLFSYAAAHLLNKITLEESVPKSKVEEFVSVEIVQLETSTLDCCFITVSSMLFCEQVVSIPELISIILFLDQCYEYV